MILPPHLTQGPLNYLMKRRSSPVAIIASGPSIANIDPTLIADDVIRFRMNMFLTEPEQTFGKRVDGLFWANDYDVYYELLLKSFENNTYDYKTFFTPNSIKPQNPEARLITERCRELLRPRTDHWFVIAHAPRIVHNMLQRPLPTQAFQVLAASLVMGFREIHLIGVDMYSDKEKRYAHEYGDAIKQRLDPKDFTPGYENAAHAQWRDLAFLDHLVKCFPDARIFNASPVSPLREKLPDSPLLEGKPITVSQPIVTLDDEEVVEPPRSKDVPHTPQLINFESEAMRWRSESAALRASTSYKLGNAIVRPFHALRAPFSRSTVRRPDPSNAVTRPPLTEKANSKPAARLTPNSEAIMRETDLETLVICHETDSMTGGYRPIKEYVSHTKKNGHRNEIVSLISRDPTKRASVYWPSRERTIINSIAPIEWASVRDLLKHQPKNTWFYLHEMGWIFERIRKEQPEFYNQIENALTQFPALCVSEVQRDYIVKTFNPPHTEIVYNVAGNGNTNPLEIERKVDAAAPVILMVGTIQERKGAELFCEVADLSSEQGLPYRFQWVGHQTDRSIKLSNNVDWLGNKNRQELQRIYKRASRFLLSSYDDPFPLSCIEALSFGVPVVSYVNSGVCEIIDGMPGCAIFKDRDPHNVLSVLKSALNQPEEPSRLFFHARTYTDTSHFVDVFNKALGLPPDPGRRVRQTP